MRIRHNIQVGVLAFVLLLLSSSFSYAAAPGHAKYATNLPAYYGFTKTVKFQNTGQSNALNVNAHVILEPPATPYAKVTLTSESLAPISTHYDQYGNLIGIFHWSTIAPGHTVTLRLHYQATASEISYHFPKAFPAYNKTSHLYQFYTNPRLEASQGINTGSAPIVKLDRKITQGIHNPEQKARAIFQWITQNIHYNYSLKASGSALKTLQSHLGICSDFADLYVTMLRTEGIPARLVGGYVTNNGNNQAGFHQWTEFYLPSMGWVVADPTWGNGYFASLQDDWHVPLYDGIRSDISVHWEYAPSTQKYPKVAIHFHYAFKTESNPPTYNRAPHPILAVSASASPHQQAAPMSAWSLFWHQMAHALTQLFSNIYHKIAILKYWAMYEFSHHTPS